jgi:hypothetical protein
LKGEKVAFCLTGYRGAPFKLGSGRSDVDGVILAAMFPPPIIVRRLKAAYIMRNMAA